ncbi:hypothetical protein DIURU_002577 [Diutina rugosa]|uniref:Uncharacterized protein n=1 Tax=Diutina rugosa TaxID=5481 RepID=A0A642URB6_DIURU|nr:uncharacterized protein DIURU_002577 [Diutina rugosa]KAA8902976.1 hypothetical protein DIURU_002577 [Diutina rugosa]
MCGYSLASPSSITSPSSVASSASSVSSAPSAPTTPPAKQLNRHSSYLDLPQRQSSLYVDDTVDESMLEGHIGQVYQPRVAALEHSTEGATQVVLSVEAPLVYESLVQQTQSSTLAFTQSLQNVAQRTPSNDYTEGAVATDSLSMASSIELGLGIREDDSAATNTAAGAPSAPRTPAALVERQVAAFDHYAELALAPDTLLCYDYVDISTTSGALFDPIVAYLYANCMVFVHHHSVIGQVQISDVAKVAAIGSQLVVSLTTDHLPELIFESHPVAIVKWEILLKRLADSVAANSHASLVQGHDAKVVEVEPLPLKQLTTNAWDYHPEVFDQWESPELVEFAEQVVSSQSMDPEVLVEAVPAPGAVPLNLILCVCVDNHSDMSREQYGATLARLIRQSLSKLRDCDTLALVFVGAPGASGSFIGSAPPSWDGWDQIIDDIEVPETPVLSSSMEEFTMVFEKLHSLYPFIPDKLNRTNKVLVVSSNHYENDANAVVPDGVRRKLAALERLSLTVVRVGGHTAAVASLAEAFAQPIEYLDTVKVTYATHLLRFDDYDALDYELRQLIDHYQRVVVPVVKITVEPSALTEIGQVEVAGQMRSAAEGTTKFVLVVKDVIPGGQRNVLLSVGSTSGSVVPRFAYTVEWDRKHATHMFTPRNTQLSSRAVVKRVAEMQVSEWLRQGQRLDGVKSAIQSMDQWEAAAVSFPDASFEGDDYIPSAGSSLSTLTQSAQSATTPLDEYFSGLLRELNFVAASYSHGDDARADAKGCDIAYSLM